MNKPFRIIVGCFLLIVFLYIISYLRQVDLVFHTEIIDFQSMTEEMNTRNIVTSIYLGPRLFDTFLEIMVVVLTVFGMRFVRNKL